MLQQHIADTMDVVDEVRIVVAVLTMIDVAVNTVECADDRVLHRNKDARISQQERIYWRKERDKNGMKKTRQTSAYTPS